MIHVVAIMHRTYSMRQSRAPTVSVLILSRGGGPGEMGCLLDHGEHDCHSRRGWTLRSVEQSYRLRSTVLTHPSQASQLQNPPPPPSSTKSGRLFKSGFGEMGDPFPFRATDNHRPCSPTQECRCLRARSRQEALAAGEDGEERHAKHGARRS